MRHAFDNPDPEYTSQQIVLRYVFTERSAIQDMDWVLSIDSPLAANYILRRRHPTTYDAVRDLINAGILFHIFVAAPLSLPAPPKFWGNVSIGIGVRFHDYVFTRADFLQYEEGCAHIIAGVRGHAVYMQGGIIWRLAFDTVLPTDVASGPSGENNM